MKKVLLIIASMCLIGVGVFIFKDTIFPYRGEFIAFKGVYHKTSCDLVKYSTDKEIKLYPDFQTAVKEGNMPCNNCNAPYYTVKELEGINEKKKKIDDDKKIFVSIVNKRFEERKQQILTGTKKDLTSTENEWKDVYQKSEEDKTIISIQDFNFRHDRNFVDMKLKAQIGEEVIKEREVKSK